MTGSMTATHESGQSKRVRHEREQARQHVAMVHLFDGKTHGGCDLARVMVKKVPDGTPLGPVP